MPRMDGLTLLGRLQEREDHPATVIVSAYGDMANIRTAMNRGAFDFVTKPIDFADLETTIVEDAAQPGDHPRLSAAPAGGGTGARAAFAVFFAESGGPAGRPIPRHINLERAVARHHLDVHRYRQLHHAGGRPDRPISSGR